MEDCHELRNKQNKGVFHLPGYVCDKSEPVLFSHSINELNTVLPVTLWLEGPLYLRNNSTLWYITFHIRVFSAL